MSNLSTLKGVGEALAEKLSRIGILSVNDLLFHLPRAYQDRTRVIPLKDFIPVAFLGKPAFIEGEIIHSEVVFGRRRSLLCLLMDPHHPTKTLGLRLFYFNAGQQKQFIPGKIVRAYGEIRSGKNHVEMIHPEYKIYDKGNLPSVEPVLTPVYALTEGLTQNRLRGLIQQAFEWVKVNPNSLPECLPSLAFNEFSLLGALQFVHCPPKEVDVLALLSGHHPAQQRLILEELVAHRLSMEKIRRLREKMPAPPLVRSKVMVKQLINRLPFKLTQAQWRVSEEIAEDLSKKTAMHRLLQGDVGSGKTLVALIAALHAVENGAQVAVMAPTEILAEQHYLNFRKFLCGDSTEVLLLTGSLSVKKKNEMKLAISSGKVPIAVGTQALFQEGVEFKKLGLVIIDEQHRFGVEQRQALMGKSLEGAHQLIMTATPIPRTLAMTSYADLDVSIIDEMPTGRKPITTLLVNQERRMEVIDKIRQKVSEGQQVYWVCTLIEESETLDLKAAEEVFYQLNQLLSPLKVGLVHGRMKPHEKQEIMQNFKSGFLNLLVATTVIEVGVDVPNATLMIIENPERLGLAQLHQLRGRVGRGDKESFCVLLYQAPLSKMASARLRCLRETSNGFEIAEKDLELRGAGEVLGTKQTGNVDIKIADLIRDRHLLTQVKKIADQLIQKKTRTASDFDRSPIEELIRRWLGHGIDFSQI
jgi:ATP-dependent DNA helicase RecG